MHTAEFDFQKVIQPLIFFNSRICHDMNNLITGGMGAMALLEHKCESQSIHELRPEIDRINQAMDEFSAFTHKLEQFFWAGEGEKMAFDLARIVALQVEQLSSTMHPIQMNTESVSLPMDGEAISIAIAALVKNAQEALPEGGDITITLHRSTNSDSEEAVLEVVDQGIGIEQEHMEEVFTPFYSLTKRGNLVGLGLSCAGIVVARHGGSLTITSAPGKGTRVTARFPL